jgi:hypothetical protein
MAEPCLRHEVRGRTLLRRMWLPLTLALSPWKNGERERAPLPGCRPKLHKVDQFATYQGFATNGWVGKGSP